LDDDFLTSYVLTDRDFLTEADGAMETEHTGHEAAVRKEEFRRPPSEVSPTSRQLTQPNMGNRQRPMLGILQAPKIT